MRVGKIVFASMLAVCFAQGADLAQELTKEAKEMKGDSRIFSGEVRVTMLFEKNAWRNFSGARVHFSPKARSAWHTHPAGQTLIVTQGVIYTGTKDGIIHTAEAVESIACLPDVVHWHGAGLESSGTHIKEILESLAVKLELQCFLRKMRGGILAVQECILAQRLGVLGILTPLGRHSLLHKG